MFTELQRLICAFVLGIIFGPLSRGPIWLLASTIIVELTTFFIPACRLEGGSYCFELRVGIVAAGFLGWILGRTLALEETGCEHLVCDRALWNQETERQGNKDFRRPPINHVNIPQ
jgi:hypothetical protein